jgi:hypothetical protein
VKTNQAQLRRLAAVLAASVSCSLASAERRTVNVTVHGIGGDSCASYVLALNENRPSAAISMDGKNYYTEANAYTQWISGFVAAANYIGAPNRPQIDTDFNGIALSVKAFCERNPSDTIFSAASRFIESKQFPVSKNTGVK